MLETIATNVILLAPLCSRNTFNMHKKRRRNRPAPMELKKMAILIAICAILNVPVGLFCCVVEHIDYLCSGNIIIQIVKAVRTYLFFVKHIICYINPSEVLVI